MREGPDYYLTTTRTEFDEPEFTEREWLSRLRPIGYQNLEGFLERRKAPKHRKHIEALLERYGCADLEGFLQLWFLGHL